MREAYHPGQCDLALCVSHLSQEDNSQIAETQQQQAGGAVIHTNGPVRWPSPV